MKSSLEAARRGSPPKCRSTMRPRPRGENNSYRVRYVHAGITWVMYDARYTGRFSDNDRKGRNFWRIAAVDVQLGALSKCTIAAGIREGRVSRVRYAFYSIATRMYIYIYIYIYPRFTRCSHSGPRPR